VEVFYDEINNKNNGVPKDTEYKMYSTVVSLIKKKLPDDGLCVVETCCSKEWMYNFNDILKYLTSTFSVFYIKLFLQYRRYTWPSKNDQGEGLSVTE
jgi:hypothetical protein